VAFEVSRLGILFIIVAVLGTSFAAMPWIGLGADVSPEAEGYLEQRYGKIGLGLAAIWVVLMGILAVAGIVLQFVDREPRRSRRRR